MNNIIFGYARVSTKEQNEERQISQFNEMGIDSRNIYLDRASGKNFDRTEYLKLKSILRSGDTVCFTELSRMGRNYKMILEEYRELTEKDITIKILDMPILNQDYGKENELFKTVINSIVISLLSFNAQNEREAILTRQRQGIDLMPIINGKKVSKKTGNPVGRPNIEKPSNFDEVVNKWKNKEVTGKEAKELLGLKNNTFYEMVKNS